MVNEVFHGVFNVCERNIILGDEREKQIMRYVCSILNFLEIKKKKKR